VRPLPRWAGRLVHKIRGGASAPDYENDIDMRTNGELRLLREVAPSLRVAFDVGANVGDWIERLLSVAPEISRVYAFEPSRSAYDRLSSRSFPSSVVSRQIGFSSNPGTATLHVFGEASGMNSLHDRRGLEDGWGIGPATSTEDVTLDTLDRFCESEKISAVDFLKIDTEGHEVDVLEGARESLSKGIFAMIQFEYGGTYIDSRRLLKDVFALFTPVNYTVFLVTPHGLVAYPRYDQRLENFQYKNFVALREDAIARNPSAAKGLREMHS
jgi:FkbM family methyltransferase